MKTKSVHRSCRLLAFACLAILSGTKAFSVVPPPDGGYPGGNTAEGQNALQSLTTGGYNTGVGWFSLRAVTTGQFNTAIGAGALVLNTADGNTATGVGALLNNTTGTFNTGNGVVALFHNTGGEFNTGIGSFVLFNNTTGSQNMAMGDSALVSNTTGSQNVAIGVSALRNSNADHNIAIGQDALVQNTTGNFNVGIGQGALRNNDGGVSNTAVGTSAGFQITGSGNICIGSAVPGVAGENNTIRIGDNLPGGVGQSACYIGGIYIQSVDVNSYGPVYIDGTGKLGTMPSSLRFKRDIQPMENTSEAILALRPVTFHYKQDGKNTSRFGLIAEEVEKINPDLVVHDKSGEPLGVHYDQINAMLINEFLKEHQTVQELKKQVAELTAGLHKLSVQFEVNKSARQIVRDDH